MTSRHSWTLAHGKKASLDTVFKTPRDDEILQRWEFAGNSYCVIGDCGAREQRGSGDGRSWEENGKTSEPVPFLPRGLHLQSSPPSILRHHGVFIEPILPTLLALLFTVQSVHAAHWDNAWDPASAYRTPQYPARTIQFDLVFPNSTTRQTVRATLSGE
ncbi:hypothetical protein FA15DRAFT_165839 [Coprinopsis marcescibilis]|uniref:Uncharacterized protein n=1 Tax=Coprinopsis marcescibilis TaxID=230819 RepID=A0A5C3KIL6_COPMA|nr:hypothetical protein FA15DRAFT_165839 [Coprinopsis marcescibilis]